MKMVLFVTIVCVVALRPAHASPTMLLVGNFTQGPPTMPSWKHHKRPNPEGRESQAILIARGRAASQDDCVWDLISNQAIHHPACGEEDASPRWGSGGGLYSNGGLPGLSATLLCVAFFHQAGLGLRGQRRGAPPAQSDIGCRGASVRSAWVRVA
jgi:hypothetical protein